MTNLLSSKTSPFRSLALVLTLILSGPDFCLPVVSVSHSPGIEESSSPPLPQRRQVSPEVTNPGRQIGNSFPNPIPNNLHRKGNGQEGGGQGLKLTDVSAPSSEFGTTSFKRSKDLGRNLNSNSHHPSSANNRVPYSHKTNVIRSSAGRTISINVTKNSKDPSSRNLITYNRVNDVESVHVHHSAAQRPALELQQEPIVVEPKRFPSDGNRTGLERPEIGPCRPVIVNQTLLQNRAGVEKWARELVKITQCVANCLRTLRDPKPPPPPPPPLKYNKYTVKMSHSKNGMNGIGGSGSPPGISSHVPSEAPVNNNGASSRRNTVMKDNLNYKLLSSCQKTCKFHPRKSTTTTPRNKRKGWVIESNKEDDEMKRIPHIEPPPPVIPPHPRPTSNSIPIKRTDFSSPGLEITLTDTAGLFHLQWPKISSPTSDKSPTIMLYTVVLVEKRGWKLIDQTLAPGTQISLVDNDCEPPKNITEEKNSTWTGSGNDDDRSNPIIRVFAVSSGGLEKVFSGYLSCYHHRQAIRDKGPLTLTSRSTSNSSQLLDQNCKQMEANGTLAVRADESLKPTNLTKSSSWGLHPVSMVYENFLVVTEVSWTVPVGLSSTVDEEKVTRDPSGSGMKDRTTKHNFLLSWEIFGGGLTGNLVTDTASGTISLWPDTAYFIQVGLINMESPDSASSKTNSSGKSGSNGQTYLNSNLASELKESIIFPLSDGEPSVTMKSERLFVNTSQLSIPSSLSLSRISTPLSASSSAVSNSSGPDSKSNNPKEQDSDHGEGRDVSSIRNGIRTVHPKTSEIATTAITNITISNIAIGSNSTSGGGGGSHVSKNGNDHSFGNGYMADSPQASKYYDEGEEPARTLRKNYSSSGTNGYEDKKRNINDNKSNNNLRPVPKRPTTDHSKGSNVHGIFSRPDVYQSLFALDSESSSEESGGGGPKGERPSVVYSVFVLVVVASVIFLFLVSFIGFFVVTSSISETAQYFVPKKLRIWVVGETELLESVQETDEEEDELGQGGLRDIDDLDDEDGGEWGGILNSSTTANSTSISIQREC